MVNGTLDMLMVRVSSLTGLETYMRGTFGCQWLTVKMEYSPTLLERLTSAHGCLIRSMASERRYGRMKTLNMMATTQMESVKDGVCLPGMAKLNMKENGGRMRCTDLVLCTFLTSKSTLANSAMAELKVLV